MSRPGREEEEVPPSTFGLDRRLIATPGRGAERGVAARLKGAGDGVN